jgi:Beta-lactamase superfamily domain
MRISFIGHASFFLESGDITLLTDPWWNGPCFGAQWWIHPRPFLEVLENRKLDYIYVSHGHSDHLHPGTLARFNRETKILVAKDLDIGPALRKMGFSVLELPDGEEIDLGAGLRALVRPTMSGDSMLAVSDGREVCVNLNDALHATPIWFQNQFITWLKKRYPTIDYLFCGYGTASHFPNCYRIPGKDYAKTAARRQHHFNAVWAHITQELKPKYAFPFAADVLLLEQDLFWANEPVHNAERPVYLLSHSGSPNDTHGIDLASGFVIEDGEIKSQLLRVPVENNRLLADYKAQIEKANYYPEIPPSEVSVILSLLNKNLEVCEGYLKTFSGDYNVLLRFRNSHQGIAVAKSKRKVSAQIVVTGANDSAAYDVIFTTRLSYAKRSLDSPYGNEIMFVGSGCLFDFPNREMVSRQIHQEIRHIVQSHDKCPSPRYGSTSPFVHQSKQLVKRTLGIREVDLYDLEQWTDFLKS